MRIREIELFRYRLPLIRPIQIGRWRMCEREGYLICLVDDSGTVGYGELAPLPGFSSESLEDVQRCFSAIASGLRGRHIEIDPRETSTFFGGVLDSLVLSSSTRFGLDVALLNLLAAKDGVQPCALLADEWLTQIPVAALIGWTSEKEILAECRAAAETGFKAVKVKVGRQAVARDASLVRTIDKEVGDYVSLRLDANRAWTLAEAVEFVSAVAGSRIEYIEEPLRNPGDLGQLFDKAHAPLAVDETMKEWGVARVLQIPGVRAIVIKPPEIGGLAACDDIYRRATTRGISCVVSAEFQSGVGITALASLAASFMQEGIAMGLGTYDYLSEDVLIERLDLSTGTLDLKQAVLAARSLRLDKLQLVT